MARRGFPEQANLIQERWLSGDKEGAVKAVPDEYIDMGGLFGPKERIRERYPLTVSEGATGQILRSTDLATIGLVAEIVSDHSGLE